MARVSKEGYILPVTRSQSCNSDTQSPIPMHYDATPYSSMDQYSFGIRSSMQIFPAAQMKRSHSMGGQRPAKNPNKETEHRSRSPMRSAFTLQEIPQQNFTRILLRSQDQMRWEQLAPPHQVGVTSGVPTGPVVPGPAAAPSWYPNYWANAGVGTSESTSTPPQFVNNPFPFGGAPNKLFPNKTLLPTILPMTAQNFPRPFQFPPTPVMNSTTPLPHPLQCSASSLMVTAPVNTTHSTEKPAISEPVQELQTEPTVPAIGVDQPSEDVAQSPAAAELDMQRQSEEVVQPPIIPAFAPDLKSEEEVSPTIPVLIPIRNLSSIGIQTDLSGENYTSSFSANAAPPEDSMEVDDIMVPTENCSPVPPPSSASGAIYTVDERALIEINLTYIFRRFFPLP